MYKIQIGLGGFLMQYLKMKIIILLKKDIPLKKMGYTLGSMISNVMLGDEDLKILHETNTYKMYSFDLPMPLSENNIYLKDRLYSFHLNSINADLINKLQMLMSFYENNTFKIIMTEITSVKKRRIATLETVNPVLIVLDKNKKNNMLDVTRYLNINKDIVTGLVNRYNRWNKTDIKIEDAMGIFQNIQMQKNFCSVYIKDIKYVGAKYKITVSQTKLAQELAFLSLFVGLGQKASVCGAGYVKPVFLDEVY